MFAKLFNLFRKTPEPIEEEVPPIPSPVKKVSTSPCCGGHCPPKKERPKISTREIKPPVKRPYDNAVVYDDMLMNSIIMGAVVNNYPEEHKSSPVETTHHSHDSGHSPSHSHSHSHSYDSPSHSHSYDSGHSHSYDSGSSYDSGGCDSGGGCD
jgi:uncharacterized membrane protein YgcG